ncbi:MAG: ISNCY family transposase, partial [Gammaproteobacteria bacterium]|nr:ISNCY family transposase [Gammaproteobacteria bacterium]
MKSEALIKKCQQTLKDISKYNNLQTIEKIHHYIQHAERQINQVDRRVLKGEVIPHEEKVFSIF